jgi:hypothetical protein
LEFGGGEFLLQGGLLRVEGGYPGAIGGGLGGERGDSGAGGLLQGGEFLPVCGELGGGVCAGRQRITKFPDLGLGGGELLLQRALGGGKGGFFSGPGCGNIANFIGSRGR